MSRIHEALQKARQERATILRTPDPVESLPPRDLTLDGSAVATAVRGDPAMREESVVLTPEALEARCPQSSWSPDPGSVLFADPQDRTLGTEEFRSLRSRLYQIREREKQPLQTLLVASAMAGEGKTFVAVNLARAIVQQRGRRVLLIDTDLRLSRMHSLLGATQAPGVSEYLRGEADMFAVIQRGPQEGLFFIGGGKTPSNPAELIGSGRLKPLIQRLAPVFDWIILDSPPSVPLTDASLLAEISDGVLMVVKADETPYDIAQKGCQQFRDKHLVGVVLNRVAPGTSYSAYYYSADGKGGKNHREG
jgi:capsular exopolysaccharide synthesis family protein